MFIRPLNIINTSTNIFRTKENTSTSPFVPSAKSKILSPLTQDTVSFSGSTALNHSLLEAFDNYNVCRDISQNAEPAETYLKKTLKNALSEFVESDTNNGVILPVVSRVKTPDSIREKVASELENIILKEPYKAFSPNDIEAVKKVCGDIIGSRIILKRSAPEYTSKIIDALIKEVEAGRLKITKIENYEPDDIEENWKYFQKQDLERLLDAVNSKRKEYGQKPIELNETHKSTGYMALHLDVDLSNPDFKAKNNNYRGEIQIVGYDVSGLKDVEDFCYKLKSKKDIKSGNLAYKPFVEYFNQNMAKTDEYPELDKNFLEYTRKAYSIQRHKAPMEGKSKARRKYHILPTIEQCGLEGKIPEALDFNKLSKIKHYCDKIYELTSEMNS